MHLSISHLEKVNLFKELERDDLIKLVQLGKLLSIPKGTNLITESDRGNMVYAIIKGRVDIRVSLAGTQAGGGIEGEVIATLKEGNTVGEMVLVGHQRRTASARAKDDVMAASWDHLVLEKLFEDDKGLGYRVMKRLASSLAERLSSTNMVVRNAL